MSYTTGFCPKAVAAGPILGIIIGFENANGQLIQPSQASKGTTAFTADIETVTAAADNQTNAQQVAVICCDPYTRWSAQVNGTLGSTNSSNLPGCRIDVDSANTNYGRVLESTATRTETTVANLYGWGADPDNSARLLVSICDSELFNHRGT